MEAKVDIGERITAEEAGLNLEASLRCFCIGVRLTALSIVYELICEWRIERGRKSRGEDGIRGQVCSLLFLL